ncbi:MAG: hypothetical protein GFH27_549279n75 [Chloroflexi bacterium AL-W]|nr:hypothetical protein [Chloroflexi bacterium AL-N1]NOK65041.1 hypothetical protein [Chloroflexi bacterium AL-N10]NOK72692.1 hypothetical protein [Chloroflexi bacterium AL-N5]NOK79220.1 hypothetical protein [Chloroflexi bacterium AL-W]NOK87136.1 hypothetical protein [Chloroflexi bacterium AL-N15]
MKRKVTFQVYTDEEEWARDAREHGIPENDIQKQVQSMRQTRETARRVVLIGLAVCALVALSALAYWYFRR